MSGPKPFSPATSTSMTTIRWLHFTDLHQGINSQKLLWPQISSKFLQDLSTMYERTGPWDLVFFSGDLTQRGNKKEFQHLDETLEIILNHIEAISSIRPLLIAVPGNHDLKRPTPDKAAVKILTNWDQHTEIHDTFWSKKASEYRSVVKKSFEGYVNWWKPKTENLNNYQEGILPGDHSSVFEKDNFRLGIVGLNSAFLQLTNGNFKERLTLGAQQIHAACGGDGAVWAESCNACILITHHPLQWLSVKGQESLRNEIAPPGRFLIHLFGHMHEHKTVTLMEGGGHARREWQGSALFGLETFTGEKEDQIFRQHGYSIGEIKIHEDGGQLQLWPRRAEKRQAGGYGFGPDNSFELINDAHTPPEPCTFRQPSIKSFNKSEDKSSSIRPLRVLLLSTERDLGSTRREVAEILTTTRGVEVLQPDQNLENIDLVILFQGFLWEDGSIASLWECSTGDKYAIISDSEGEWPPFRYIDKVNVQAIESFRETLTPNSFFNNPSELREKAVEIIDAALAQRVGNEAAAGLHDWERSYLKARMIVWTAGRTAGSHIHLHDAEMRGELYSPDLYVPLKATSARWMVDEQGTFCLREKTNSKSITVHASNIAPIELERWVTVTKFPRVVIVGAPGGGKTVFLTRVAAELARARLGLPERWMTLDVELLRTSDGATPIPIVVEAARIAKHELNGPRSIAEAMLDELSAAGVTGCDVETLLEGLEKGRYALLVDALDEIPSSANRVRVLDSLKALGALSARVILTTRSARYTGELAFGMEFELVDVASLDRSQVASFCQRWALHRHQDESYLIGLRSAVSGLDDQVEASASENALTGSPLMLTAVCMVYDKHHSLPDDRARLCELLVDDLCRSRKSEDTDRGWSLSPEQKRDLLQCIALAMQESGAQSWPESEAILLAMTQIPVDEAAKDARARRHLDWTADHTGLLRFQ